CVMHGWRAFVVVSWAMGNRFYDAGPQRAVKVNELFSGIASRYDLINDLQSLGLHRYWKRRVIRLAGVRAGMHALDVCCGTGDLTLALARAGAEVVGLDFSEQMLEVAEQRKSKAGRSQESGASPEGSGFRKLKSQESGVSRQVAGPNPKFIRGDAQQIPFPDNSFEIVTVGYGLRNLMSWEMGLREMQRVAAPG